MKKMDFRRLTKFGRLMTYTLIIASVSLVSCDKKEDEENTQITTPTTPPPAPENPIPGFADGKGTLVGVQSRTFQNIPFVGVQPIDLGLAVAVFYNSPQDQTFLDAGTVTANGETLKRQSNNSYVYTPGPLNQEGIDYLFGEVEWDVSGGANVMAFTRTNYNGFPEVDQMLSDKKISRAKDYTLESASITGADSVIFMIGGILHIVSGANSAYTFTAAELGKLKAGPNYAQITGYNYTFYFENGEKYYYVNETVVTEQVTLE